jgi:outer membrane protein TolC
MRPGLTISLLALAALGGAQSPPGDALTLDQAVREAEQNAFGVRSARASLTKAQEQTRQAAGLLGPKLTLGANYTRLEGANAGFGQNRQTDSKQASATVSQLIDVTGLSRKASRSSSTSCGSMCGAPTSTCSWPTPSCESRKTH